MIKTFYLSKKDKQKEKKYVQQEQTCFMNPYLFVRFKSVTPFSFCHSIYPVSSMYNTAGTLVCLVAYMVSVLNNPHY